MALGDTRTASGRYDVPKICFLNHLQPQSQGFSSFLVLSVLSHPILGINSVYYEELGDKLGATGDKLGATGDKLGATGDKLGV
ncbi:MAG: hypothetical protein OXC55_02745 [Chloroflexi bacterium]|nr:hypothetical protein [Chloroflexota bacterium]